MKKILSIILLFTTCYITFAQGTNLDWAHGLTGRGEGHNILADTAGNTYLNGWASNGITDANPNPLDTAPVSGVFLSKYDKNGNYSWSVSLGSSNTGMFLQHSGICFDKQGNIIIAGSLYGRVDFDPSADSLISDETNGILYLAKYTPSGNLIWAKIIPASGSFTAGIRGIDVDERNNIIWGGALSGNDINFNFNPSGNAIITTSSANGTFFMAKYDEDGNYLWVKSLPGLTSNTNRLSDLAIDTSGSFYITGEMNRARDFNPSADSLILSPGNQNAYLAKYDAEGNLQWANLLRGGRAFCRSAEIDNKGNVYISGVFRGSVDFDLSADSLFLTTISDGETFIAKYTHSGSLIWAKSFTTAVNDNDARGMKYHNGYLYISGFFTSDTDFDPSPAEAIVTKSGAEEWENYVAKLDEHGNYIWAVGFGNSRFSFALDIASDAYSNIYTTGLFRDTSDFDPSDATLYLNSVTGNSNTVFIAKYTPCFFNTANAAICTGDTLFASTLQLTESGSYPVSYISGDGCDSVVLVSLTVEQLPDIQVSTNGNILTSNQQNATYQWVNCTSNFTIIDGETDRSFSPSSTGSYAVIVTGALCSDTSECFTVTPVSIVENTFKTSTVFYPNPTQEQLYVDLGAIYNNINISLSNVNGSFIEELSKETGQVFTINLNNYPAGMYFITIHTNEEKAIFKIIKK